MEIHIELSAPLMELLLIQAAEQEIPAEDLVIRAIQNYMKRGESIAD